MSNCGANGLMKKARSRRFAGILAFFADLRVRVLVEAASIESRLQGA